MPTPRLFVELAADSTKFQQGLRAAQSGIQNAGSTIKNVGRGISQAGGTLSRTVTAPLVGIGIAATKAAVDWETAFTGVRKTVDATDSQLANLEKGLRGLALEIPISAGELAGVAEAAGQLGISTDGILDFTKTMAMLSVTTNLGSEEAATALARFANITGMGEDEFENLGSAIVALGNSMATTEADIVSMSLRLAGAGSTVGMTEQDIVALAASLSSVGIQAEAGGTAMSRVMGDIAVAVATGGDDLERFAKIAGMSADGFAMAWEGSPMGAMFSFVQGLRRMQDNGEDVFTALDDVGFGGIRVRDSLLRLAGGVELLGDAIKTSGNEWAGNTALAKEAELRFATMASKLQLLKNRFTEMMITVGGPFITALTAALVAAEPFLNLMAEWATRFAEADPATQQTILAIAGLAAAAGPLLVIIGSAITVVGGLVTAIGAIPGIVSGAGAALGAIATVLTGPVGLAIAAVIGIVALLAVAWKKNWGDIQGKTAAVVEWFRNSMMPVLKDIATIVLYLARIAIGVLRDQLSRLMPWISNIATALRTLLGPAFDWVAGKVQGVVTWIGNFANKVRDLNGGTVTANTNTGFGGQLGSPTPALGPRLFPGGPGGGGAGQQFSTQRTEINAPLIGAVTVRDNQDIERIQAAIETALDNSLGASIGTSNRSPYGVGAY